MNLKKKQQWNVLLLHLLVQDPRPPTKALKAIWNLLSIKFYKIITIQSASIENLHNRIPASSQIMSPTMKTLWTTHRSQLEWDQFPNCWKKLLCSCQRHQEIHHRSQHQALVIMIQITSIKLWKEYLRILEVQPPKQAHSSWQQIHLLLKRVQ